jgi:rhomboid protease GluP
MAPRPLSYGAGPLDPGLQKEWAARRASRPAPLLTLAIIAGLAVIFAAEYAFNVGPVAGVAPGRGSLIALGAVSRDLVLGAGEPWRLVTAVLLHANPAHIIGNGVVLLFAGAILERLVGRAWLAATFVVSGLAGSIAALLLDPAAQPSLGASGAIMGVLTAAFVCSYHPHAASLRRGIQIACAFELIPALIPFSSIEGGPHIDYNCHGGGFLAGLVMGFVMRALWPTAEVHPGHRRIAAGIGWAGLALAGLSFAMVALHYSTYAQAGERYATTLPALTARTIRDPAFDGQTLVLVRDFPHDPRTHLLRAEYLLVAGKLGEAEDETSAALAEKDALASEFPGLETEAHMLRAAILVNEGRDAASEAGPWCVRFNRDPGAEDLREHLLGAGVCRDWSSGQ